MESNLKPRNKPAHACTLNFEQEVKNIQRTKESLFKKKKSHWSNWISAYKKMHIDITLHKTHEHVDQRPRHKTNTQNLIEQKVGKSIELVSTGNNFLDRTPMGSVTKNY